jgi:hypothetical protein
MAAKRSDHVPLCILTNDQRNRRCRENLSALGALPGRDITFAVSQFAQGTIHLGGQRNNHKYTLQGGSVVLGRYRLGGSRGPSNEPVPYLGTSGGSDRPE